MSIADALIVNAGSTSVKLTRLAHGRPRTSPTVSTTHSTTLLP
jgi:hypothetical protein